MHPNICRSVVISADLDTTLQNTGYSFSEEVSGSNSELHWHCFIPLPTVAFSAQ